MGYDDCHRKLDSCARSKVCIRVCVSERLFVLVCTCVHECIRVCPPFFSSSIKGRKNLIVRFNQNLNHVTIILIKSVGRISYAELQ